MRHLSMEQTNTKSNWYIRKKC